MKRHLANSPTLSMLGRVQEVHAFFSSRTRTLDAGYRVAVQHPPMATAALRTEVVEGCFSTLVNAPTSAAAHLEQSASPFAGLARGRSLRFVQHL